MRSYRPDIDGLRFLAVLPVMLFHARIPWFDGGYVGVDVFFVISGYLITGIISKELNAGRFSLLEFYERRARRILPALLVTIAATMVAAAVIALPSQFASMGVSMVAAALFSSNIYFWKTSDYFADASEMLPLLHTWSLSVEEQFYIFFPVLLILIAKWRQNTRLRVLLGIMFASAIVSVYGVTHRPVAAFFLAPTRAWELLLGSLLAFGYVPVRFAQAWREPLAIAGFLGIAVPVALYTEQTGFPGLAALPPCIGTAILLQTGAGKGTMVSRLMSLRPVVWFGLISYSLYLWHWPVLAFLRMYLARVDLEPAIGLTAIAASTGIAVLSWHFVERPFRNRGFLTRAQLFALAGTLTVIIAGLGAAIWQQGGVPDRFSRRANDLAAAANDFDPRSRECMSRLPSDPFCRIGTSDRQEPDFLLWGDSHAGALLPAIESAALARGRSGMLASRSACPPLLGVVRQDMARAEQCRDFNDAVVRDLAANGQGVNLVILAGRWALLATGERYTNEPGLGVVIVDAESGAAIPNGNLAVFERGLQRTIAALVEMGKSVVVLGGVPEIGWNVPLNLARAEAWRRPTPPVPTAAEVARRNATVDAVFERLEASVPFRSVSLAALLCPDTCLVLHQDRPLYLDDNHLSRYGAAHFVGPSLGEHLWPAP